MRRKLIVGSAVVAAGIGTAVWRRTRRMDLRGKVVLITGGSHGLGLALAREFARNGSKLMLCGRKAEALELAQQDLAGLTSDVHTMVCDVSDRQQVQHLIAETIHEYGVLDIVVNNAGIIQVGPIHTMALEHFEHAMAIMFWGIVHTTMAALPYLRERPHARIVNITSIGAKVSVPHLVPYSCAKSAAAAFSEGMRAELQNTGVKVVTIAPGLMRTGSYLNAIFNAAENGEAAWFSAASSLPGLTIAAAKAARQVVSATRSGTAEVILGVPAKVLARFHGLFPAITTNILGVVNRALPKSSGETKIGSESRSLRSPLMKVLTTAGRAAARDLQPAARQTL